MADDGFVAGDVFGRGNDGKRAVRVLDTCDCAPITLTLGLCRDVEAYRTRLEGIGCIVGTAALDMPIPCAASPMRVEVLIRTGRQFELRGRVRSTDMRDCASNFGCYPAVREVALALPILLHERGFVFDNAVRLAMHPVFDGGSAQILAIEGSDLQMRTVSDVPVSPDAPWLCLSRPVS